MPQNWYKTLSEVNMTRLCLWKYTLLPGCIWRFFFVFQRTKLFRTIVTGPAASALSTHDSLDQLNHLYMNEWWNILKLILYVSSFLTYCYLISLQNGIRQNFYFYFNWKPPPRLILHITRVKVFSIRDPKSCKYVFGFKSLAKWTASSILLAYSVWSPQQSLPWYIYLYTAHLNLSRLNINIIYLCWTWLSKIGCMTVSNNAYYITCSIRSKT